MVRELPKQLSLEIIMKAICVDNFGEEIHVCRYTGELTNVSEVLIVGSILPNVKIRYIINKKNISLHKESVQDFNKFEANCNTCIHLERVKHEKQKDGFLFGKCKLNMPNKEEQPYKAFIKGEIMMFHPEDPMHMKCYTAR